VLVAHDISGIESHQLVIGSGAIRSEVIRNVRGWTDVEWAAAKERLRERELLDADGLLTEAGTVLRARIELLTDELAMQPYADAMDESALSGLTATLQPVAAALVGSGLIPVPNPIGVDPIASSA
jgi:hypothetical protein